MNRAISRALMKIGHTKKNTLFLFLAFGILSFLMSSIGSFFIAVEQMDRQVDHTLGGEVSLFIQDADEKDPGAGMELELLKSWEKDSEIELTYVRCSEAASAENIMIHYQDDPLNVILQGVSNSGDYLSFKNNEYELLEGRHIEEADYDRYSVLVSNALLSYNQLHLGDKIQITLPSTGEKCELSIIGIYSCPEIVENPMRYSPENTMFLPYSILADLKHDTTAEDAAFSLKQASQTQAFVDMINESELKSKEDFHIVKKDYEYLRQKNVVFGANRFLETVVVSIYIAAMMIIVLLTVYLTVSRTREFGILLSMGEKRGNVILQMFLELLAPTLGGLLIGYIGTAVLCFFLRKAGSISLIDTQLIPFYPGIGFSLIMIISEVILVLIAVGYPALKIMKLSPKQILQK